jgi:2-C-methyl-D-erythritol 2,4-cyclodiphosphate synthase
MKEKVGHAISVPLSNVSIKATTTDHLGFVGREEGMSAYAVALLEETP